MSDDLTGLRMPDAEPHPVPNDGPSAHDLAILHISTGYDDDPHIERLTEIIKERKEFGLKKYGTLLQAYNGRNALKDALDEAVDLIVYSMQARMEMAGRRSHGLQSSRKIYGVTGLAIEAALTLIELMQKDRAD